MRYHTLQLLSVLLENNCALIQGVVLANPLGVARLMDMASEREVVRNEALLLLNALARDKEDIQKLLAFEGAFERLFSIVQEEGGTTGGVVVQDCLELANNLLRNCAPNQLLFRESGLAAALPGLLLQPRGASASLSRQAAANVLCTMELVHVLLMPVGGEDGAAAVRLHQALLSRSGLLAILLPLALGDRTHFTAVSIAARLCAAQLVAGCAAAQEELGSAVVTVDTEAGVEEPALLVALQLALQASAEAERAAAACLVASYCQTNAEGQQLLVSTLMPIGCDFAGPTGAFGSRLVAALMGESAEYASRAASLLPHLLMGNLAAKELLLRVPLEVQAARSALPELLMPRITRLVTDSSRTGAAAADRRELLMPLLRLLLVWLYECPSAVAAFLSPPGNLPMLIDLALHGASTLVSGFAAAVLGVAVVSNAQSGGCDAQTVVDTIVARLTLSHFFQQWEALRASPEFHSAASPTQRSGPLITRTSAASAVDGTLLPAAGSLVFTAAEAALLTQLEDVVRSRVLALYARPQQAPPGGVAVAPWNAVAGEPQSSHASRLQAQLYAANVELEEQRGRNAALSQQALLGVPMVPSRTQLDAAADTAATLARVRAEAERELASVRALASRHEESLRALSQAYNTLEAAHFQLEEQLRQRGDANGSGAEALLEAASAEHEQELNDLLVCLGQEETKVERLREALLSRGCTESELDTLLADLTAEPEV